MILGVQSEAQVLQDPTFLQAYSVGDDGTALREASLGRKLGFDFFMAQNTPYVDGTAVDTVVGAINHATYPVGTKSFTVDIFAAAISAGSWITIAGDNTPLQVTSTSGGSTPTTIVTAQKITAPVADDAAVTVWGVGAVNNASGYAQDWAKEIVYDVFTLDPQVGQGVSFNTSTKVYGIVAVDTNAKTILLDRPLEAAIADDDTINTLPAGSYNFAFHKNAVSLVTRPLALPMQGTGARAGIANFNNMSMRVVMTYDGNKQGTLVTLDTLLGIKVLDSNLGAVMLG